MTNQILDCGHPLAFQISDGTRPSLLGNGRGKALYTVETRMLGGHQKEAIVQEGVGGQQWRLTSDEGLHMKGHDAAPFPLGFFNAGLLGDVMARVSAFAAPKGISVSDVISSLRNYYWFEGSFTKGTGKGQAEPSELKIEGAEEMLRDIVAQAVLASPAIGALNIARSASFALYVNGRRETITTLKASTAPDVLDPYVVHSTPPAPLLANAIDVIVKPGVVQDGERIPAPDTVEGRLLRRVAGTAKYDAHGRVLTNTWLDMPGMSHFILTCDDRPTNNDAPSGLAYYSTGVAFCFMTQLSRYMAAMKLDTGRLRLVQNWTFEVDEQGRGIAHPVDTHLFLNGRADAQTHEMLVRVAESTCYLHAALRVGLPPKVSTNILTSETQ